MRNLYRNEIWVLLRSKAALINACIFFGIQLLVMLIYVVISHVIPNYSVNADSIYTTMFTITNDGIYVIEAMVLFFVARDFQDGTIRNRIIAGYPRTKVYFAKLLAVACR